MVLARVPKFIGVCVRAGTMDKAIKVRTAKMKLDPYLQKVRINRPTKKDGSKLTSRSNSKYGLPTSFTIPTTLVELATWSNSSNSLAAVNRKGYGTLSRRY